MGLSARDPGGRRTRRARRLRAVGERADGFAITAQKTVAVPVERFFDTFADGSTRGGWLPDGPREVSSRPDPERERRRGPGPGDDAPNCVTVHAHDGTIARDLPVARPVANH
jgi:hypothetical protein